MQFTGGDNQQSGWETISSETHFENAHLSVATETVRSPARREGKRWTTVHRKAAVVVAPITSDGKLVLIRQERIAIRAVIWEAPAGQIDSSSEPDADEIAAVALRELREETGYQVASGGHLSSLGDFFSSAGFTDEHCYHFFAQPVELSPEGFAHDDSESILDCRSFTAAEIGQMIAQNEIRDANTLGICAKLAARGVLQFHV